jgi:hypothetical protein
VLTEIALAAEPASNSGLLNLLLGGGLVATVIAGYRFAVNFRLTERGMRSQATRDRRKSQHEAGLWQARTAALEYIMIRNGITPPPMDPELSRLVMGSEEDAALPQWDDPKRPDERLDR